MCILMVGASVATFVVIPLCCRLPLSPAFSSVLGSELYGELELKKAPSSKFYTLLSAGTIRFSVSLVAPCDMSAWSR